MKVAIYCRTTLSEERNASFPSTELQEKALRLWAIEKGHAVVQVFTDEGYPNALYGSTCGGIAALIDSIRFRGNWRAAVALDQARYLFDGITTSDFDGRELLAVGRAQADGILVRHPQPLSQAELDWKPIDDEIQEVEARERRRPRRLVWSVPAKRATAGKIVTAREGRYVGSHVPYGYRRTFDREGRVTIEPHPVHAPVVRLIFSLYLTRPSLPIIQDELQAREIHSPRGLAGWSRAGLAALLSNPVYQGEVRYLHVKGKGNWEPLVTRTVFRKARQLAAKTKCGPRSRKELQHAG